MARRLAGTPTHRDARARGRRSAVARAMQSDGRLHGLPWGVVREQMGGGLGRRRSATAMAHCAARRLVGKLGPFEASSRQLRRGHPRAAIDPVPSSAARA